MTHANDRARRLMIGTTSSPCGTASAPPGQKSFCTSITSRISSIAGFAIVAFRGEQYDALRTPSRTRTDAGMEAMKITQVRTHVLSAALSQPFAYSRAWYD